jgi:CRP-like cAMP-binding protein
LFKGLSEALMREVEAISSEERFAPGDQILRAGQTGDGQVYFIESGQVASCFPCPTARISALLPWERGVNSVK